MIRLVRDANLDKEIQISSAGTAAYHEGEKPDPRSRKEARWIRWAATTSVRVIASISSAAVIQTRSIVRFADTSRGDSSRGEETPSRAYRREGRGAFGRSDRQIRYTPNPSQVSQESPFRR